MRNIEKENPAGRGLPGLCIILRKYKFFQKALVQKYKILYHENTIL